MENQQLLDYRHHMLDRLVAATEEFCAACRAVKDPYEPVKPGSWNAHQLAAHTQDVDANVYGMRIRRSLEEVYPIFPNYDGEKWIEKEYDPAMPLEMLLSRLQTSVQELAALLRTQPDTVWSRLSRHETQGERTLQSWVERALAHIEEHLESVRKAA